MKYKKGEKVLAGYYDIGSGGLCFIKETFSHYKKNGKIVLLDGLEPIEIKHIK
jgi:hypothetical protein